ncbi:MAG: aminotransferase class V-fold PLP-dependent enzyme [Ilumatobacteraceae bacterium]
MHQHDESTEMLTEAVVRYSVERMRLDPPPLDAPLTPEELRDAAGPTVTPSGLGGIEALRVFEEVLAPACISVDHPRFLSFVPAAPTEASMLFDLVVGASSIYAGSWLEGAGAIHAENEALRWIADLVGLPETAGGVFVSGGTAGNLSALIAARWRWRHRSDGVNDRVRGLMIASAGAHSSVKQAALAMDADVVMVPADERGKMTGDALAATVEQLDDVDRGRLFAVIATAGTTNVGVVDDLDGAADIADRHHAWLHVDGAYGGAALAAPSVRALFGGIERADSFIVDPHKWLFAPFDSCALLYRDPAIARAAHTQHAEYLDVLHGDDITNEPWNACDFAHHLSRRARGLPLWFSLATHGTDAYVAAVETTLEVTRQAARLVDDCTYTELLLEPELSIVLFRRTGWAASHYQEWSDRELREGRAFVTPTSWNGDVVLRICIVNPMTTITDIADIVATLADEVAP